MWQDVLTPNRSARWPWTDHVRPFSELPSDALREAIGFERHLWEVAKDDPKKAARESLAEGIHYRSGVPRLGEPIFRSPQGAERRWSGMQCGRGTGHLGTGLYFFGTLSAAVREGTHRFASKVLDLDEAELREKTRHVWVVDVSSLSPPYEVEDIPAWWKKHGRVLVLPDNDAVWKLHRFGKALLCYPDMLAAYREVVPALAAAEEAEEAALQVYYDASDEEAEGSWSERWDLYDQVKQFRAREKSVSSTLRRELHRIEWDGPKWEQIDRPGYLDVEPLAPRAQAAVDAYVQDVEEGRFPGYHPMTYYMQSIGVTAILHRDWAHHNAGDVGNIWYPEVTE